VLSRHNGQFDDFSSVNIVSDAFQSKMQPARHRMVYALLDEDIKREGGIHALQLRTKTPDEEEKLQAREAAKSS
jgi:stress-induced morphogen